jgi:hypothetical protein
MCLKKMIHSCIEEKYVAWMDRRIKGILKVDNYKKFDALEMFIP